MARNLLLTGGVGHPFADASAALADVLRPAGIESRINEDLEGALAGLADDPVELVTVYALRWRMEGQAKYAALRDEWAFSLSDDARAALRRHVEHGGGLLALHTAVICFDDWPEWRGLVGGTWRWGVSAHPPRGPVDVTISADHAVTAGVRGFAITDEVYGDLDLLPDVAPLATADAGAGAQPVLWARTVGEGRAVTDLLGHDRLAIEQPGHAALLRHAARWCCGLPASG